MWEILNNHTDIAKLLIQHNANINACDKAGETALMIATRKHNSELVKVGIIICDFMQYNIYLLFYICHVYPLE